jgi:ABC-type uncharacterized transport system permease subunit
VVEGLKSRVEEARAPARGTARAAIAVHNLERRFDAVIAVDHLSFTVQPGEVFGTINNFVVLPLYFLSAAQFPLNHAPAWIQVLAALNPLAYAVDLLRGLLDGVWTYGAAADLAVIGGFALIALGAATVVFAQQE